MFYSKIKTKAYKEHVTQFFYDNSKLFKIKNFANKKDYSRINDKMKHNFICVEVNLEIENKNEFINLILSKL